MRFWLRLRYIEREREGEAALLLGLTTRCSGRTRMSRRLLVRRKRRATRRAAERERTKPNCAMAMHLDMRHVTDYS